MDNIKYCTLDKYVSSLKNEKIKGIEKLYKILEIMRKICLVLEDIHQYGYYCLELSPRDILCTNSEIKLLDKEILMAKRQLYKPIQKNLKCRDYIAPEILTYEGFCTDGGVIDGKKADVFLAGMLLYWCVTSKTIEIFKTRYIFNGCTVCFDRVLEDEQVDKFLVCHCYLQDLEQQFDRDYDVRNNEVLGIFAKIFTKAICRNVDRRYTNMTELTVDLEQVQKILLK